MCLSSPRIFGYFQGNLRLVRVKVAFEIGRSLLKRTEQGTPFQVEKTAWLKPRAGKGCCVLRGMTSDPALGHSFSNKKFFVVQAPNHVQLFATLGTAAYQASLSITNS